MFLLQIIQFGKKWKKTYFRARAYMQNHNKYYLVAKQNKTLKTPILWMYRNESTYYLLFVNVNRHTIFTLDLSL